MICDYCGKSIDMSKYRLRNQKRHYCCYKCRRDALSKYNTEENPMNKKGKTLEHRIKHGDLLRGRGEGKTYTKRLGRHEHRIVAEEMIGRSLKKGEIVHHIDGNKKNNTPSNLKIMTQSEHARLHFTKNRGDEISCPD